VAQTAEKGGLRDLEESDEHDEEAEKDEAEKDGNALLVLKGAPLRLSVEIVQEGLYQAIEAPEDFSRPLFRGTVVLLAHPSLIERDS
jgi:hypothetical protein